MSHFFADTIGALDIYDCDTNQWLTHHQPLPIQTAAGGTGVIHDRIHYVGGESSRDTAYSDMQIGTIHAELDSN